MNSLNIRHIKINIKAEDTHLHGCLLLLFACHIDHSLILTNLDT